MARPLLLFGLISGLLICFASASMLQNHRVGGVPRSVLDRVAEESRRTREASYGDDDEDTEPPLQYPPLAPQFQGQLLDVVRQEIPGTALPTVYTTTGTWYVDIESERMRVVGDFAPSFAPLSQPYLPLDVCWDTNGDNWQLVNEQCRPNPADAFEDNFGWLQFSQAVDSVLCSPTDGVAVFNCTQYAITDSETFYLSTVVWTDPDSGYGIPVVFDSWFVANLYGPENANFTDSYQMSQVELGVPDDAWDAPATCTVVPPQCEPGEVGEVVKLKLARIHLDQDWTLANRDVADVLGDAPYVCSLPPDSSDSMLSTFEAEVNTNWGQYALCNDDVCVGGSPDSVGHTGTDHFGNPLAGQCDDNDNIGNWFSFDAAYECGPDQEIGDDGCAWKLLHGGFTYTITHACLIAQGFLEACTEDGRMPFTTSASVMQNALQGGCPDVTPPEYAAVFSESVSDSTDIGDTVTDLSSVDEGADDGDLIKSDGADWVLIGLSVGCLLLALVIVGAVVGYGVVKYVRNRPQKFGWAVAENDGDMDMDMDDI